VLKTAMASLYRELYSRAWEKVALVNSVHDELVVECPEEIAEEVASTVKEVMEGAWYSLMGDVVPVVAEPSIGKTWAEKG